jgi:hypothetical protein
MSPASVRITIYRQVDAYVLHGTPTGELNVLRTPLLMLFQFVDDP